MFAMYEVWNYSVFAFLTGEISGSKIQDSQSRQLSGMEFEILSPTTTNEFLSPRLSRPPYFDSICRYDPYSLRKRVFNQVQGQSG